MARTRNGNDGSKRPGRAGNGEGTIRPHRRRDPKTGELKTVDYEARLTLADGSRKSLYGKTRQEAARKLAAAIHQRNEGAFIARDERQTMAKYLTSWLETTKPTVEASTWERYEGDVRLHLIPALGKTRLATLTPQQVQAMLASKLNAGSAPRSVRNMRAVLRRALNEALALGLVTRNAAALVRSPKAPRGEMRVYDAEQTRQLIEAASTDRLGALIVLAVTTGMREGEMLGLHWKHVNLVGKHLQVQTVLKRLRTGLVMKDAKTGSSRRKIALTDAAVTALKRHRARQAEERLSAGDAWQESDLVFCNRFGGPIYASNFLEDMYKPIVRRAGLPYIRAHDLRHTAATLLLLQGINPKIVSEILGHASVAITLTLYSHVLPDMQSTATAALDTLLGS